MGFLPQAPRSACIAARDYRVRVNSRLAPGSLTYAECVLPGRLKDEVLFFTHTCHPSLANDNTTGMAIATALAAWNRAPEAL